MKVFRILVLCISFLLIYHAENYGQLNDSAWTLSRCIEYALQQNISVRKSELNKETSLVYLEQARASRFPSVNASVSQNFSWGREQDITNQYGDYAGSNGTNFGINSSVRLYNGLKNENSIKQSELSNEAAKYDVETIKESVTLSVLDAYLQVLYAGEQVKNSEKQIESTAQQLFLAQERLTLGAISRSDYLLVKSELATEQLTFANAQNLLTANKVNLMQLMELPVTSLFSIEYPASADSIFAPDSLNIDSVYQIALAAKPQIKSAEINRKKAELDIAIAKADYQPVLSLNGGISTGYSSGNGSAFDSQVQNRISPNVGLSLSIPVYQNRQARSGVSLARIGSYDAELTAANTRNQLRKEIEQVCSDVYAAGKNYEASREQYNAAEEAWNVANEKYKQGLLNSIDLIIQKNKLITSESDLLQSKYNLVFSYKILDFYQGKPLEF